MKNTLAYCSKSINLTKMFYKIGTLTDVGSLAKEAFAAKVIS
jgi:hypothetical protein